MPTTDENIELIETIKNPEKYFRIVVSGYGAEVTFTDISKQVHDYWIDKDSDQLVEYCLEPSEQNVDDDVDFLYLKNRDLYQVWHDNDNIVQTIWGADTSTCYLSVHQVINNDYDADIVREIKGTEQIDFDLYNVDFSVFEDEIPAYVTEFSSVEKGTFFDVTITITESFDITKLGFVTEESLAGEDFVVGITYNGEELDNWGGDTNGKGYFAQVFEN